MDSSQDVLLDWSYKHPRAPTNSEPIHREWFRDRWRHNFNKEKNAKFLKTLQRKSKELTASKLLTYLGLGLLLLSVFGIDRSKVSLKLLFSLGKEGYAVIENKKKWELFLNSVPSCLDDFLI